jgi:signal transduction histidine kinase
MTAAAITVGILVLGAVEAVTRARSMYHPPSIIDLASSQRSGSSGDAREVVIALGLMLVVGGIALACGLARDRPGWALVALWVGIGAHVVLAAGVMFIEVAAAFAAFGIGRWGDRRLLRLVGLSIPIAVIASIWLIDPRTWLAVLPIQLEQAVWDTRLLLWVLPPLVIGVLIGIPWLTGILGRTRVVAQKSERALHEAESDLARIDEIARLQGEKARVARDVHDVVGHSLTVILAQAEAARYLVSSPEDVEKSLTDIAQTARRSLSQVRDVLASTTDEGVAGAPPGELNELVAGLRTSGTHVEASSSGLPAPLTDPIGSVAYRVLQEMLTNALRHGRPGTPVHVLQDWGSELRLQVSNQINTDTAIPSNGGTGLTGMLDRAESVGGRMSAGATDDEFTVTVWLPRQMKVQA